jgi:hypothetical protein
MSLSDLSLELHKACESGNAYRVSCLLKENNANPSTKDRIQNDSTPLIKAVRGNHVDVVLVLMCDRRHEILVCDVDGQGVFYADSCYSFS